MQFDRDMADIIGSVRDANNEEYILRRNQPFLSGQPLPSRTVLNYGCHYYYYFFCFKQNGGNILLYYAIVCNESDTRGRKFLNTKQPARTILSFPRVLVRTRQLPTRLLRYDCSAAGTKESLCEYVVSSKFIAV
jgi:hypothetical protein